MRGDSGVAGEGRVVILFTLGECTALWGRA